MKRALCAALLCAAGCAPTLTYVQTGAPGPRPPPVLPSHVRLLYAGQPLPPFVELGYIEVSQTTSTREADGSGFLENLAAEAAQRGCNALVLHDGCIRTSWNARNGHRYDFARLSATCVRIDDPIADGTLR